MTPPRADLAQDVERTRRSHEVPGLAVALVEDRDIAWSEGFGTGREDGGPIAADTVFAVASLSKPPFARVVLRLRDRGLLDLDSPLAELDPRPYDAHGLGSNAAVLNVITARHVLCHSSGLGNWEESDVGGIGFPPGSRWHYSGDAYLWLQAVVEYLSGSPLERVAEAEVLGPLEMGSTSFLWRPQGAPAEGRELSKAFAAYSLHTTAGDYARFVVDTIVSDHGKEMLEPQVEIDSALGWGLGWGLAGHVFWQWGEMGHFQSVAVGSRDEGRGLVCLTNDGERGLLACVEILRAALGDEFAHPIRAVLDRGW